MKPSEFLSSWPAMKKSACLVDYANGINVEYYGDSRQSFALASVSKPLTAMTVLCAAQEEIISLDDLLPRGFSRSDLLSHQSGLRFDINGAISITDCQNALGGINESYFQSEPRQRRIYSNLGYEVLAFDLELKSQMTFREYLDEALLSPLQMHDTLLDITIYPQAGPFGAAAGIRSTNADIAKLILELIDGNLIDDTLKDRALRPNTPSLDGVLPAYGYFAENSWGLGFEVKGIKSPHWMGTLNSHSAYGHFGQSGTFLWVDPELRLACCLLTDRPFDKFAKENWPTLSDSIISNRQF